MFANTAFRNKWLFALTAVGIAFFIALIYWPVVHAQFVYVDILDFQKMAWLRHGDDWKQFLLRRFNDWISYFRPLGVALFTLEVRLFNTQPGPMHLVSLALHLINAFLVGALAVQVSARTRLPSPWVFAVPMLLYGLHPLLVEPVVWVGCQFELTATLFMLLGWLANCGLRNAALRATAVAICFFLAACSKESAFSFPFIMVILDWYKHSEMRQTVAIRLRMMLTNNWASYLAIFVAGIAYLLLRQLALGALIPSNGTHPLPVSARLQIASFLYLRYWGMFFWPSVGMGPLHPVPVQPFLSCDVKLALQDIAAACILLLGLVLAARRRCAGGLILGATFALLPVLHVIGASFDISLYHERYAMTALAVACAWLPATILDARYPAHASRALRFAAYSTVALWLILATLTVRITVPLWSNQVKLWQWALKENPSYIPAKSGLISAYIDEGAYASAWQLIHEITQSHQQCVDCMLNAAALAIKQGKPEVASYYLEKVKDVPELYTRAASYRFYLTTIAQTELLEGHGKQAESAARAAMELDRLDPEPQLVLAIALATQGKAAEAQQVEDAAIALLSPKEQAGQRQKFKELWDSRHINR